MMISANQAADYILCFAREYGELITNLKLQKLLYYVQAWHLALKGTALFQEDMQAWVHGPVQAEVYHRFKHNRWNPIADNVEKPELDSATEQHFKDVLDIFMPCTAYELEAMTHQEQPWIEARNGIDITHTCETPLSKDTMRIYYKQFAVEA